MWLPIITIENKEIGELFAKEETEEAVIEGLNDEYDDCFSKVEGTNEYIEGCHTFVKGERVGFVYGGRGNGWELEY